MNKTTVNRIDRLAAEVAAMHGGYIVVYRDREAGRLWLEPPGGEEQDITPERLRELRRTYQVIEVEYSNMALTEARNE